jgi:integrase
MGPLLHWALRFVREYSPDILRLNVEIEVLKAQALKPRVLPHEVQRARLDDYFRRVKESGDVIPIQDQYSTLKVDGATIAMLTGTSINAVWRWTSQPEVRAYVKLHNGPARSMEPVRSAFSGEIFQSNVSRQEADRMIRCLEVACFIVICYLTGMRPGEVLALEANCLTDSGETGWSYLHGRTFKTSRDKNGLHDSNGTARHPWVAVTPVMEAIRVLERLRPKGLLFPSPQTKASGRSLSFNTASQRIGYFIKSVNSRYRGTGPIIPEDKHGAIVPSRFRRTLAWFIANQPGGLIALAIQYGHLGTAISEGYAGRARDGIQTLIDFESARAIAVQLSSANEEFLGGSGVSGPAAQRFMAAAKEAAETYGGAVVSKRQAISLLENPRLTVYENDASYSSCNFDPRQALCLIVGRGETAPRLSNCQVGCANISRTDQQAERLRQGASTLVIQANSGIVPTPISDRLRLHADEMMAEVRQHDESRVFRE